MAMVMSGYIDACKGMDFIGLNWLRMLLEYKRLVHNAKNLSIRGIFICSGRGLEKAY